MAWDVFDPTATLEIEVEGVKVGLRPLNFSGKMAYCRGLASIDIQLLEMSNEADVDDLLKRQCKVVAGVITTIDGNDKSPEEIFDLLTCLDSPRTFAKITGAIWKAYHLDELKEKN